MPARWRRLMPPWLPDYAIAVLSVAAAVGMDLAFERLSGSNPSVSLFLCAIVFVAWISGTGPALFASALTILAAFTLRQVRRSSAARAVRCRGALRGGIERDAEADGRKSTPRRTGTSVDRGYDPGAGCALPARRVHGFPQQDLAGLYRPFAGQSGRPALGRGAASRRSGGGRAGMARTYRYGSAVRSGTAVAKRRRKIPLALGSPRTAARRRPAKSSNGTASRSISTIASALKMRCGRARPSWPKPGMNFS